MSTATSSAPIHDVGMHSKLFCVACVAECVAICDTSNFATGSIGDTIFSQQVRHIMRHICPCDIFFSLSLRHKILQHIFATDPATQNLRHQSPTQKSLECSLDPSTERDILSCLDIHSTSMQYFN